MSSVLDTHASARLAAIAALGLDRSGLQEELNTLTTRVANSLGFDVSLVSIVLDDAQWFVGKHGLLGWMADVGGTPIEWSFCAHVAASGQPLAVADAQDDPRFRDNPLVVHEGVRCYFGVPLTTKGGIDIGSLCVISSERRPPSDATVEQLRLFAEEVMAAIESEHPSD